MERNSKLDAMTKLLSLSYYDLPLHLKNCFLYLSIFPEDVEIANDYLSQLWIAEGFVERIGGMTLEEVAERYLHELVDRCLVQVAKLDKEGKIQGIRIHDIIRHIMLLKASEQNITTIYRGPNWLDFQNKVRRLALHGSISDNFEQAQTSCKSLRSLALFKNVGGCISQPLLSNLLSHGRKLVKLLSLREAQLEIIPDEIFNLFHLKYLDLSHTDVQSVSKSVGKLQRLETLNLSGTRVTKLPVEIQKLHHLRHLGVGCLYPESLPETFEQAQGFRASFRISSLLGLTRLELRYSKLRDDPLQLIGGLPNLVILYLTGAYQGETLSFQAGGFPRLKNIYIWYLKELRSVAVEKNAMPCLQLFWMCVCPSMEEVPTGIGNMLCLQDLNFTNMSNEFVHKLQSLDKQSEAFKGILQVTRVISSTYHGRWSGVSLLDKNTGTFNTIID